MLSKYNFLRKEAVKFTVTNYSKFFFIETPKSMFSTIETSPSYKNKSHHGHKTYRRIWPAAKNLMVKHEISEEDLPDLKVIMKEHVLDIIEKRKSKKKIETSHHKKEGTVSEHLSRPKPDVVSKAPQVVLNDIPLNKETLIDYSVFKAKLPHGYYYNDVQIENLVKHIFVLNAQFKGSECPYNFFLT